LKGSLLAAGAAVEGLLQLSQSDPLAALVLTEGLAPQSCVGAAAGFPHPESRLIELEDVIGAGLLHPESILKLLEAAAVVAAGLLHPESILKLLEAAVAVGFPHPESRLMLLLGAAAGFPHPESRLMLLLEAAVAAGFPHPESRLMLLLGAAAGFPHPESRLIELELEAEEEATGLLHPESIFILLEEEAEGCLPQPESRPMELEAGGAAAAGLPHPSSRLIEDFAPMLPMAEPPPPRDVLVDGAGLLHSLDAPQESLVEELGGLGRELPPIDIAIGSGDGVATGGAV
jgi:hypothetical protein